MMAQEPASRSRLREVLDQLIREQGLLHYALFFVVGEGIALPDALEEVSGYLVNDQGEVYTFWMSWDDERQRPVFTTWERVEPNPGWDNSPEYHRARAAAKAA